MTETHGGKRKGAGRKPARGVAKVTTSLAITPEVKEYLDQCDQSQSEIVQLGPDDARDLGLGRSARDTRHWAGSGIEVSNRFLHWCGAFPAWL